MPWELETKDGIVIRNIPDDIPPDHASLKERVSSLRAGNQPAAPRGTFAGLKQGLRDPVDAGAQLLTHALPDALVSGVNRATAAVNEMPVIGTITKALGMTPATAGGLDQQIADREQAYQAERGSTGMDWARAGGNIAATLPLAFAAPAAGLLARTVSGAATGAASGALQPVTENQQDFAGEKAKQAATGAVFGGVSAPLTGALARIIRPNTSPEVQLLMREGVTPTPGQIAGGAFQRAEDKLTSVPILGDAITSAQRSAVQDLNRAAYKRALDPIKGQVPKKAGYDAVDDVHRQLSDFYDRLLPQMSFKADPKFVTDLTQLRAMGTTLPPAQAQRFEQIIQTQIEGKLTPQGNASGETIKEVESQLRRHARNYRSSPDGDVRDLGDALLQAQSLIHDTLRRSNPTQRAALDAADRGYSELIKIENAAGRAGTGGTGVFTPAQYDAAVRAGAPGVRRNTYARGIAPGQDLSSAGRQVLGPSYPDSGSIGRLLLGGGAVTGGLMEPSVLTAAAAGSVPYLPIGRQVSAALMAKRPDAATPLAQYIRQIVGPAAAVGTPALYQGAGQ